MTTILDFFSFETLVFIFSSCSSVIMNQTVRSRPGKWLAANDNRLTARFGLTRAEADLVRNSRSPSNLFGRIMKAKKNLTDKGSGRNTTHNFHQRELDAFHERLERLSQGDATALPKTRHGRPKLH